MSNVQNASHSPSQDEDASRRTDPRSGRRRGRGLSTITRRDARLWRSARSVGRGRLRRALRGYLGLVVETPDDLQARNRAGDLLLRAGEIARAIDMFVAVAEGLRAVGFEDKAAAVDRKILRLVPDHEGARRALVSWLTQRGRGIEARRLAVDGG